MPHSARTILLADPDAADSRRLAAALRARGHRVLTAADGSKALEVAVLEAPDVVLYDVGCPLLDPRTFSEILQANPRTRLIPVVVLGTEESTERFRGGFREGWLQKPFNLDEALARVEHLLRRAATARDVQGEGSLTGSLAEVSSADLLQMLGVNRRSGTLRLEGEGERLVPGGRCDVVLREGRVVDARGDSVEGLKALYRALAWRRGSFAFSPGAPTGPARVDAGLDQILLEAVRQLDELRTLEDVAPDREDVLALAVDPSELPEGMHPVTREVLALLSQQHRGTGELVDRGRASDLEILRAVTTLRDRGLVRVLGRAQRDTRTRALVPAEIAYALHGWRSVLPGRRRAVLRIAVGGGVRELRELVRALAGVAGWRPAEDLGEVPLGEIGTVQLTEILDLLLVALPPEDRLAPLWRPLSAGASAAVLFAREGETEGLTALARALGSARRPLAVVGEAPAIREAAGGAAVVEARDGVQGLSKVLERLARHRRG